MIAVSLALGAALIWGSIDFFAGLRSRAASATAVVAVSQSAGLLLAAVVVAATWAPAPTGRSLLYAALAGVAGVVGIVGLYRGLAVGAMSIVAPITAAGTAIPVAVGVASGERPSWTQGAGLVLAFGGVVLASREKSETLGGSVVAAGVGSALLGALGTGLFLVALDRASGGSVFWTVLVQRVALVALLALAFGVRRRRLSIDRRHVAPVAVIGLLDVCGIAMFTEAARRGLLSVVSVIAGLYPVATVLLAHLVLGERVGAAQRVGVVGALVGVALITVG